MFENVSQGLFLSGDILILIFIPVLRSLASLFIIINIYRTHKSRGDSNKALWILCAIGFPIITKIAQVIYTRKINKKEIPKIKGNTALLISSAVIYVVTAILTVVAVVLMGAGLIKSEVDDEHLFSYYDRNGTSYDWHEEVPLFDENGNTYIHKSQWFTHSYTDQNGKEYEADRSFICEDGYFYYDENDTLKPVPDKDGYYTDGEKQYYNPSFRVYWYEDGTMYEQSGKYSETIFDFE